MPILLRALQAQVSSFAALVLLVGGGAMAQYVENGPIKSFKTSTYSQGFARTSTVTNDSSGSTDYFTSTVTNNIEPARTSSIPLLITDSNARKGGTSTISFEVNNIFPASASDSSLGGSVLTDEAGNQLQIADYKDLANGELTLIVTPISTTTPTQPITYSSQAASTQTFSMFSESDSPAFVNSFSKRIFDKTYLLR